MGDRPCRFCVAQMDPYPVDPEDCERDHRDDPRVYALAEALARVFQGTRSPTDRQIAWFLADADEVVDNFTPAPDRWKVRRLPSSAGDGEQEIEVRIRINDVTYVGLEGGKDCRGSLVRLSTFRSWGTDG